MVIPEYAHALELWLPTLMAQKIVFFNSIFFRCCDYFLTNKCEKKLV